MGAICALLRVGNLIRSDESDRKSNAEVDEGPDGERNLLVVVEGDVLHYTFVNFPPGKRRSP